MKRLWFVLVIALLCSCTFYTGPVKLGSIGKEYGVDENTVPPPKVTGDVTLEYLGLFGDTAGIRSPWGLSFGVDGTLYVCDRDRSAVVRLDKNGEKLGDFSGFSSRVERIYSPVDVCSSAGMSIYAVDAHDSRVLRFDRNLKNAYVVYKGDADSNALFGSLAGLAFDQTGGDLFATDRNTGSIIRIDMLGKQVTNRGSFGSAKESLKAPAGLDTGRDGELYIADTGAGCIAALDHFGAPFATIGGDVLSAPIDVAVLPDSTLAVADEHGVVVLDLDGRALGYAGFGRGKTMKPRSVAHHDNRLYISDAVSGAILVYRIYGNR